MRASEAERQWREARERAYAVTWCNSHAMLRSVRSCLVVLAALAACADQDAVMLTTIKDAVCACETTACTDRELARVPQETIKSTHRTQTIAREMMECVADVQSAALLADVKTKLCECTNAECVDRVQEDTPPLEGGRSSKLTKRLLEEMRACAQRFTDPGSAAPASAKTP